MKPEIVEMLTNQLNTVAPVLLTFRYANKLNAHVKSTATYGTPRLLVLLKIFGACLARDIEYKTLEPEYRNEFPADQAEVSIAALMA